MHMVVQGGRGARHGVRDGKDDGRANIITPGVIVEVTAGKPSAETINQSINEQSRRWLIYMEKKKRNTTP